MSRGGPWRWRRDAWIFLVATWRRDHLGTIFTASFYGLFRSYVCKRQRPRPEQWEDVGGWRSEAADWLDVLSCFERRLGSTGPDQALTIPLHAH